MSNAPSSPVKKINGFMAGAVLGAEDEELKPYPAERLLPEPKEHTQRGQRELILKVALWPPCAWSAGLHTYSIHSNNNKLVFLFCFVLFSFV